MSKRFEQRFEGKDNAGLRAEIRGVVGARPGACGPSLRAALLSLDGRIALTARGRSTLRDVAEDYASGRPEHSYQCDCVENTANGFW